MGRESHVRTGATSEAHDNACDSGEKVIKGVNVSEGEGCDTKTIG